MFKMSSPSVSPRWGGCVAAAQIRRAVGGSKGARAGAGSTRAGSIPAGGGAPSLRMRATAVAGPSSATTLAEECRADFPILATTIPDSGKRLVYLDNAASSQTPTEVVEAHEAFHRQFCANVHRGVHYLSGVATDKYEAARVKVGADADARKRSRRASLLSPPPRVVSLKRFWVWLACCTRHAEEI